MATTIKLDKMSVEEKLQMMESIWDDLCSEENQVKSPVWHNQVLENWETAIKQGQDEFIDWSDAKKLL